MKDILKRIFFPVLCLCILAGCAQKETEEAAAATYWADPNKQTVYDYARKDLEQLTAQGQEGPRFFAVCTMKGDTVQTVEGQTSYSGSITCALYGFPEGSGTVGDVTLQTCVDGEVQTVEAGSLRPSLSGDIQVVQVPFHAALPDGSTLECVLEAETADGFLYRHTAMTMIHDVDSLKFNCKTERYDSTGEYLDTIWSGEN